MEIKPSKTSGKIDKELQTLLNDVIGTANERDLIIRAAIHAENVIDKWLEKKTNLPSKTLEHSWFIYEFKLQILNDLGNFPNPYLSNLRQIGEIRNIYAHTLNPNEQSIRAKIANMKVPHLVSIDTTRVNPQDTPLEWFKDIAIATIVQVDAALKYDNPLITEDMLSKTK